MSLTGNLGWVRIAMAGGSGFVGRALAAELIAAGHEVVAFSRHARELPGGESCAVDVADEAELTAALAGCDAAYYLVHSLGVGDFRARDRDLAEGFGRAAATAGVGRIVYLGGLGDDPQSEHLASRQEVGGALASTGVPVVELRAAVVLGAGSVSFEMLRYLTERLPFMICPRWVHTAIQPIALSDVIRYLVAALDVEPGMYEIGGADVTTYRDMITAYADVRGLRQRLIVDVPLLTPRLSSYWFDLVTPVDRHVSHALIESLVTEVVVGDRARTDSVFGIEPMGLVDALAATLNEQAARARLRCPQFGEWSPRRRLCGPRRASQFRPTSRRASTTTLTASATATSGTASRLPGGRVRCSVDSLARCGSWGSHGRSVRAKPSTGGR